jgi:hypothetical protein
LVIKVIRNISKGGANTALLGAQVWFTGCCPAFYLSETTLQEARMYEGCHRPETSHSFDATPPCNSFFFFFFWCEFKSELQRVCWLAACARDLLGSDPELL